jgi:hypothetical protein
MGGSVLSFFSKLAPVLLFVALLPFGSGLAFAQSEEHEASPPESKPASEHVMTIEELIKAVGSNGTTAQMAASTAEAFGFFKEITAKVIKAEDSSAAVTATDNQNSLLLSRRIIDDKKIHTWLLRVTASGEFIVAKHVSGDLGPNGESVNSRFAPISDDERAAELHDEQVFWAKQLQGKNEPSQNEGH